MKIHVVIDETKHEITVEKSESANKKIQKLVKELGMNFRAVKIMVHDFPVKGRHLIKKSGYTQLNAIC